MIVYLIAVYGFMDGFPDSDIPGGGGDRQIINFIVVKTVIMRMSEW